MGDSIIHLRKVSLPSSSYEQPMSSPRSYCSPFVVSPRFRFRICLPVVASWAPSRDTLHRSTAPSFLLVPTFLSFLQIPSAPFEQPALVSPHRGVPILIFLLSSSVDDGRESEFANALTICARAPFDLVCFWCIFTFASSNLCIAPTSPHFRLLLALTLLHVPVAGTLILVRAICSFSSHWLRVCTDASPVLVCSQNSIRWCKYKPTNTPQ
jgi:hypothetical protein